MRIDGALDEMAMIAFCSEHGIRMIIDAAHPFAALLHHTIATTASTLSLPVVRFERIYPPRDPAITWIDDYTQIPRHIHSLLATTGVQSISKLKPLEADGISILYRILNRQSSIALALKQGASQAQLCYYDSPNDIPIQADAILLKESGLSGGFTEKVEAAKACGMEVIAIKRPALPESFIVVDGPYGLRRAVEKWLPEFYPLHSGLTTGTCATAAAVAACIRLSTGETPAQVPVMLPNGETIHVAVNYGNDYAACIKEAGDDPDVTNGIEVRALVTESDHFEILGGEGVGRFTLPGFDYPPGEAAINKAPREMIRQNLGRLKIEDGRLKIEDGRLKIVISVPLGAEIARRTFNPRLGIEGGISIIGVSGIVKPFSEEAFVDSIRKCMTVAKASGSKRVVINSGGKSERFVKALYPTLPQQAFVEYGNYIGETLKIAHELDIRSITLGVMIGKAVKLAAGHLDTHSKRATMDKAFISEMLDEAHCDIDISDITLAREIWERLSPEQQQDFADVVISHCAAYCQPLLPNGELTILLIADDGTILPLSPAHQPVPSRS